MTFLKEISATVHAGDINAIRKTTGVITETIQVKRGSAPGLVLTSDEFGNGTWMDTSIDPSGTITTKRLSLTSDTLNTTTLSTDPLQTVDYNLVFPSIAPNPNQVLSVTDVNGNTEWVGITIPNVITVTKEESVYGFTSINDAMSSILDATASNPYIIRVGPGIFTEDDIVVKSFVTIEGIDSDRTIINPIATSEIVVTLSSNSSIKNVTIDCLSILAVVAINVFNAVDTKIVNIQIANATIAMKFGAELPNNTTCTMSCVHVIGSIDVINIIAFDTAIINVTCFDLQVVDATSGGQTIAVSGSGASLSLIGGSLKRSVAPVDTLCTVADSASIFLTSLLVSGYTTLLSAADDGGIPNVNVSNITSNDLSILVTSTNVNLTGCLFSSSPASMVNIPSLSSFTIANRDNRSVNVALKGGDFSTVEAALAYVTTQSPSEDNSWTIMVGNGTFIENNPLTVPKFVTIAGKGANTTLSASVATSPLFTVSGSSTELINMILLGADGVGGSGVHFTGDNSSGNTVLSLKQLTIRNCETAFDFNNSTGTMIVIITDCNVVEISSDSRYGIHMQKVSTLFPIILFVSSFIVNIPATTVPSVAEPFTGICTTGLTGSPISSISINNYLMTQLGSVVGTGSTGLVLADATISMNDMQVSNIAVGINIESSVLPVNCSIAGLINIGSTTTVINANNSTTGSISGVFMLASIDHAAAPLSTLTYLVQETTGGLSVTGDVSIGQSLDTIVNVTPGIVSTITPGLETGGVLSMTGGLGISVAPGTGYITTGGADGTLVFIEWVTPLIDTVPADVDMFISVLAGPPATLQLTLEEPDRYNSILIGRVKSDSTDILYQQNIASTALHTDVLLDNTTRIGLGPIVSAGIIGSAGTVAFALSVSSGRYFFGTHEYTPTGGTNVTFTEYFHAAGVITTNAPTTSLTAAEAQRYDNGTDLVTLPATTWTKHTMYIINDGIDEYYAFVYGQDMFATQNEAENSLLPLVPAFFGQNFCAVSALVLQSTSTDWVTVQDIRPTLQFTSAGVTATSNHGSLTGLLNDDHPQYMLTSGSRPMIGSLDMGSNTITNVTTINGVDITDLSGRLQPGGADELATATSVTIGTVNNIGSSTSLSRADHIHAHGVQTDGTLHATATTGTNGFMSTADKTKLDNSTALSVANTLIERDGSSQISIDSIVFEPTSPSSGESVTVTVPATFPAAYTITLPPTAGVEGQTLKTNGSGTTTWQPSIESYIVNDTKSIGTNGGVATSGSWIERTLNTLIGTGSNVSLNTNKFELKAGTWKIYASAPAFRVERNQIRLLDLTNNVVIATGSSTFTDDTTTSSSNSYVSTVITISDTTSFIIEHRVQTTSLDTLGFGVACKFGDEVYTTVILDKIV